MYRNEWNCGMNWNFYLIFLFLVLSETMSGDVHSLPRIHALFSIFKLFVFFSVICVFYFYVFIILDLDPCFCDMKTYKYKIREEEEEKKKLDERRADLMEVKKGDIS